MRKVFKIFGIVIFSLIIFINVIVAFNAYHFSHYYELKSKPNISNQEGFLKKYSDLLFGKKNYKSKVVDSLPLKYETIYLETEDNQKLECWYIAKDSAIGTVINFHGLGQNKSAQISQAIEFYKLGYNVLMTDFRAHGNSSGNFCTLGIHEAKDVKVCYEFIQQKNSQNIILYGQSLGASTILKAIESYHLKPQKIILDMPYATMIDGINGKLRTMNIPEQPTSTLLVFWAGLEFGTWAFNFKPAEFAKAVNCPVLLQWGFLDKRVKESETNLIYKNLASHNKYLIKYIYSGHSNLLISEPEKWKSSVQEFLKNKVTN